jgi:hypothetical protein
MEKVLVVFFSRTGKTKRVAEAMARSAGWDIEAIREPGSREGLRGYLRSGWEAYVGRTVPIEKLQNDPAKYDVIVVAGPVWAAHVSSPVRTFLERYNNNIRQIALLVTCGGSSAQRVADQMQAIIGLKPRGTLLLSESELAASSLPDRLRQFAETIAPRQKPLRRHPAAS